MFPEQSRANTATFLFAALYKHSPVIHFVGKKGSKGWS